MAFVYGGVAFPLPTGSPRSALQDADPVTFILLDFCAAMIRTYVGDRMIEEAAKPECNLPLLVNAVADVRPYEPGPFLLGAQSIFPSLFVHRQRGKNDYVNLTRSHETTTWQCAYVFPALDAAQAERLLPLRWAIRACLLDRIENGQDDSYTAPVTGAVAGQAVWPLAGLEEIEITDCAYGGFDGTGNLYLPALTFTIVAKERHEGPVGIALEGMDMQARVRDASGTSDDPVAELNTNTNVPP